MKKLVRLHGLWTMIMIISWIMCVFTGHQMIHEMKESDQCRKHTGSEMDMVLGE